MTIVPIVNKIKFHITTKSKYNLTTQPIVNKIIFDYITICK